LKSLPRRTHTGLPAAFRIEIRPGVTRKKLALQIMRVLKEKPIAREFYDLADEVAQSILCTASLRIVLQ
jgi:hypothetical protein